MTIDVTIDDAFARDLAATLGERPGSVGERTIIRASRVLGERALRVAARETLRILDEGGMPTLDGARQRTAGGVLLRLIREACDDPTRRRIFGRRAAPPQTYQSTEAFRARFAAAARRAKQAVPSPPRPQRA